MKCVLCYEYLGLYDIYLLTSRDMLLHTSVQTSWNTHPSKYMLLRKFVTWNLLTKEYLHWPQPHLICAQDRECRLLLISKLLFVASHCVIHLMIFLIWLSCTILIQYTYGVPRSGCCVFVLTEGREISCLCIADS